MIFEQEFIIKYTKECIIILFMHMYNIFISFVKKNWNFIVLRLPVVLQVLNTCLFQLVVSALVHTESFDLSV
jgi:hypothetical protein